MITIAFLLYFFVVLLLALFIVLEEEMYLGILKAKPICLKKKVKMISISFIWPILVLIYLGVMMYDLLFKRRKKK